MCGICGYSTPNTPIDKARFETMTDLVQHRGPDGRGGFYAENLALGHRRLAILDLSDAAAQPFHYQGCVAVYNGEIYNHVELRKTLQQQGYQFTTSSDTEVLLAAYKHYGEACVQHFNGMWAFCIFNPQTQDLFCSRDRFGVKPFYYTLHDGVFSFGSEIKQLLHMQDAPPKANRETLLRFLALGEMDESEETLFEDVFQLLPGHNLCFNLKDRTLKHNCWFTLPQTVQEFSGSYQDACAAFEADFTNAVALRLRADVPVGSCLSGGIDSSAIVGTIHELLKAEGKTALQHTVSSCYDEAEFNEQSYIDDVVAKTGAVSHKVFPTIGTDTDWLDKQLWHNDEPVPSSSGYSQWSVFEEAKRQGLTVMLDGQGADEQLAGYAQFHLVYFTELLRQRRFGDFKRELNAYKRLRAPYQPVSAFSVAAFCLMSALLPKKLMRGINGWVIKTRKPRLFSQKAWKNLLLSSGQYTMPSTRNYIRQNVEGHLRLLLHLEDRNSMAHSIETRVPFMDPALATNAYALPFGFKIRDGVSKAVLRDGLRAYLPESVYARQNKMGFPAPEAAWIKANEAWFRTQLQDACRLFPDLLDEGLVTEGFNQFMAHPQTGEFVWWRIMCTGRWAKIFKVQYTGGAPQ